MTPNFDPILNPISNYPTFQPDIEHTEESAETHEVTELAIDALTNKKFTQLLSNFHNRITGAYKGDSKHRVQQSAEEILNNPRDYILGKISQLLLDRHIPLEFKKIVFSQLSNSDPTDDELSVFNAIINFDLSGKQMAEILKGAHVRIDDGGHLYDIWSNLSSAHERISSHPSLTGSKQYGIMGPWTHEILFGVVEDHGKHKTFFQLENTPWASGIKHRVGHTLDATKYLLTRSNIGPYGISDHVDKNPIRLHYVSKRHAQ